MKRYDGEQISQRLLSPQLVQLSGRDMALFAEIQPYLDTAGFPAETFDERSVCLLYTSERRQVQEAMEQARGDDRVKTVVHGFTRLGILEITRKRTGETLQEMLTEPCRACGETGRAPVEWP